MVASARLAQIKATTQPAGGSAKGTSRVTVSQARVRLADVTATSVQNSASVRLAAVVARTFQAAAGVRLAEITATAPQTTLVWDGTKWVSSAPPGVILSRGSGKSNITVRGNSSAPIASKGSGKSKITLTTTRSGTLAMSGTGALLPSGAALGSNGKSGEIDFTGGGTLKFVGNASQGPAGFGSVSVFTHADASPPYVEIDLTGFLGSTAALTRIDQAGNRTAVRLANPASLDGGSWFGKDYETPYGVPCTYECVASLTQVSDPVTLDVETPWLIHPGIPTLSQPLTVTAVPQRTYETNQGVHNVMGRTTPLVVTDGARRAATYELAARTETASDALGLETLLADTQVLLLQIRYPDVTRSFYEWVAVGQVSTSSLTDYFGDDLLAWTLAITVTSSPDDANQGQRTLAALAAEFSTLREIAINYATLADIIADNLIGS